jgi:ubiquinone/menaquinone biosynthesis C-methylase UbiE
VPTDVWAEWLRSRRTGGSAEARRRLLETLAPVRDRILDAAEVCPGVTVLDVGCGDGLVGLGALERGADVVFSDISQACLDDCRAIARDRARYHLAPATDLGDVDADVVTTRSVLIYVADKQSAFDEFFRVLRAGGRLSIYEPINRFGLEERRSTYGFADVEGIEEPLGRLWRDSELARANEAMVDFDERDLVANAERAGFAEIELELHIDVRPEPMWKTRSWDVFVNSAPNPLLPTFAEAMAAQLTEHEIARVTAKLRPQVEQGLGTTRFAEAYLLARKV